MRKLFVLVAVLGLVAGACGGDSGGGSCESVADDAIVVFQDVINEFDSMTLDELAEMGDEEPPAIAAMETKMDDLQKQADDLDCSDAEMESLFMERLDNLTADGMFGQLMLDELQEGDFFE